MKVTEEKLVELEPSGELSVNVSDGFQELVEHRAGLFQVLVT
jgi:hypothetical protein